MLGLAPRKEQQYSDAHIAELREVVERKGRPKTAKALWGGLYGRIVTGWARASYMWMVL